MEPKQLDLPPLGDGAVLPSPGMLAHVTCPAIDVIYLAATL
jgi:hypothetical protein